MVILEILVAITFILEAGLEKTVIDLKNPNLPNYPNLNRREHIRSALWAFFYILTMTVATCFALKSLLPLTFLLVGLSYITSRRIFFDYFLKFFRGRPLRKIEGDQFVDNTIRRILGKNGGRIEIIIVLTVKALILYFLFR